MQQSALVIEGDGLSDLGAFNVELLQVEAARKGQGGSFQGRGSAWVSGSGACLYAGVKLMIVTFDNHQKVPRKGLSLLAEKMSWDVFLGVDLRPQHFAQSYSVWWLTGLAIFTSHTFELLAVHEIQRCEGAVLEGVNVAWKSRGGRCIWQW